MIWKFGEQALSLLAEGVHPAIVEQASAQAGFRVGVLALLDEVSTKTTQKVQRGFLAEAQQRGETYLDTSGEAHIDRMVDEFGRPGRLAGKAS